MDLPEVDFWYAKAARHEPAGAGTRICHEVSGGVSFGIRGQWSGSVALGVITIRSSGLAYAVPQAGVAYTLP